jgi:predicted nucleic acid-binding protein
VTEFVLDASFTLRWCFEDEATPSTESLLTTLQNQEAIAWAPAIWRYEILNGLGKGVSRGRLDRPKAFLLWQELQELGIRIVETPIDRALLELALDHNLAVYDASYLSLAQVRNLPLATVDGKLQNIAASVGIQTLKP